MSISSTRTSVLTGLALILMPLIAWAFKLVSLGWMLVFIVMGPIVILVIGYVLQLIIASQGFLSRRDLFGARTRPATIAAWVSSVGVVLLGIFLPDGGDSHYGSTLQVWLGANGDNEAAVHAATDTLNTVLAFTAGAAWIVGFLWLMFEWTAALARRAQGRAAASR